MNETYVDQLRAVADYIARDDVPKLLDVSFGQQGIRLQASADDGEVVSSFLGWVDTLDGEVDLTATPGGFTYPNYRLDATGTAAGMPMTLKMIVRGDEYAALYQELTGHAPQKASLTRTQLAKISDPELLNDREEVSF